ncbi:MAG TPA: YihY/virulence factor BrkB family protein [Chitinophagaceae bacterium]
MNRYPRKLMTLAGLLKDSANEFLKNDPLRMAGATAFFTTFALPPILVIIIQSLKYFTGPDLIRSRLFDKLRATIGAEAVAQVIDVLNGIHRLADNWWVTIGGFIFLLFVATTLFRVIKNSINQLWKIRPVRRASATRTLVTRLKAVVVILVAGVLMTVGLMIESMQVLIGKYLFEISPLFSIYFNTVVSSLFSILITTTWFVIVLRYLPDGKPRWGIAWVGGLLTSLLFMLGRIILHWLLTYSSINYFYTASASIVLLLLFVFYSAMILYFGACFTKVWAVHQGHPIEPRPGYLYYRLMEVDSANGSTSPQ